MKKNLEEEIIRCDKAREAFYSDFERRKRLDRKYVREGDIPLTEEEIKEIDEFWGKYSFAYPEIDYESFRTFKNRYGKFDVRHCPGNVKNFFHSYDPDYVKFQNKAMQDWMFPDMNQPEIVLRRMKGAVMDSEMNIITQEAGEQIILDYMNKHNNGVVFKRTPGHGGKDVFVLDYKDASREKIIRKLKLMRKEDFVVQALVKQSSFLAQLNEPSVNTIRISTWLDEEKCVPLAALIRVGQGNVRTDNWHTGGALIGVDIETGKLNSEALLNDLSRSPILANGFDLSKEELYVPNFEKIVKAVTKSHPRMPYIKVLSWDMTLDENNEPTMIECNFRGETQIHEMVGGPFYGDYLQGMLDRYLLKEFYLEFAEKNFLGWEYHDHVKIMEYIGDEKVVVIPSRLRGKPVRSIDRKAFRRTDVEEVVAKQSVIKSSKSAFKGKKVTKKTKGNSKKKPVKLTFTQRLKRKLKKCLNK